MTAIPASHRCPTGDIDRMLAIGWDATISPPRVVIAMFRRPADGLTEGDFRPTAHVVTLEFQYVPVLIERLQQILREHLEHVG